MTITVEDLARRIGGDVVGDPRARVSSVCAVEAPRPGGLCVVWSRRAAERLAGAPVTACVTPRDLSVPGVPCIQVGDPRAVLVELLDLLHPRRAPAPAIEAGATVSPTARCDDGVYVAAGARVGPGARLATGVEVHANAVVGEDVVVGEQSVIMANATVHAGTVIGRRVVVHSGAVVGSSGFGLVATEDGRQRRIPQIGTVILEDDVEVGACTTIDRATLAHTVIRRGTKIDNLVQIAHNCDVGEDCVIVGQAGLAGSVVIGDRTRVGGQAGVADSVVIGADARIAAQAGVADHAPDGDWMGSPALPAARARRVAALTARLPELHDAIRQLRTRCSALEEEVSALRTALGEAAED
jgi:UDP-3-O-[3-hydroxymyristoyl] glucosamine N-acyltransferase